MVIPAHIDPPEVQRQLWDGLELSSCVFAFDVGANTGTSIDKLLLFAAQVVCFEPAEESFEVLKRDYGENDRVVLDDRAVSSRNGWVDLVVSPYEIERGMLVSKARTETLNGGEYRAVRTITIDSAVRQYGEPSIIKVDVEGHELDVLEGAELTAKRIHPTWIVEIHSGDLGDGCFRWLSEHGYEPEVVRHSNYSSRDPLYYEHYWLKAS